MKLEIMNPRTLSVQVPKMILDYDESSSRKPPYIMATFELQNSELDQAFCARNSSYFKPI